ncbi:hypothetical protein [Asticcacaulis sp. YBE204]|uniref:hypothetical protein n=1 Tax=Asticcacaulis sp. YBE204 TaxID=1282363 RepID=UPI0003C3E958|nr:hypothetical protein [Asticcacaulis sp. YBE204]ESQ79438.1 hypothetical protein AEYBE204_10550 [Asticcacaulis sp. YBE204]
MAVELADLSYELSDDRGSCFPGSTQRAHIITVYWQEQRVASGQVSGDSDVELQANIDAYLARTRLTLP